VGAIEFATSRWDASAIERLVREFQVAIEKIAEVPQARRQLVSTSVASGPFYFETQRADRAQASLYAMFHPARGQARGDQAILLCNPLGQEYLRAHWALRQLTQQLTRAGLAVLRFDYFATGDSEGDTAEGSVDQWQRDIVAAARQLKTLSGASRIHAVGLRLGALLAASSQAEAGFERLVLWDSPISGQTYLDEITKLHQDLILREPFRKKLSWSQIEGSEQLLGFPMPRLLRQQIAALSLAARPSLQAICSRPMPELETLGIPALAIVDGGQWDRIEEAHGSLLAPSILSAITQSLTADGRRS
jgi:hypothetical protein